ncbi:MAG: hypothetical protein FWG92_00185 [Leptospirales bacterium]|nr:hypothetical protein [Leptospirales bacterium]
MKKAKNKIIFNKPSSKPRSQSGIMDIIFFLAKFNFSLMILRSVMSGNFNVSIFLFGMDCLWRKTCSVSATLVHKITGSRIVINILNDN